MRHSWKTLGLLLLLALAACSCAGVEEKYPSREAQAFFTAANEANFRGVMCQSPQHQDLSAYTSLMGVKYPPTSSVEVLSEPPSRPYQAFARLQCSAAAASPASPDVSSAVLTQLTDKAKAIGADAILICAPPAGPGRQDAVRPAQVEAVAIKYRLENPEEKKRRP